MTDQEIRIKALELAMQAVIAEVQITAQNSIAIGDHDNVARKSSAEEITLKALKLCNDRIYDLLAKP